MHRFFVEPEHIQTGIVHFPADISHQIARVLRLGQDTQIMVLDNSGKEYLGRLDTVDNRDSTAVLLETRLCPNEPDIRLELQISLTQREKFEWILQKCTEIGVGCFTPVISNRTLIQRPGEVTEKYPRWHSIIREAAEQSSRGRIPELRQPVLMEKLLKNIQADGLRLVAWEGEHSHTLKTTLRGYHGKEVSLLIGPEGGFSEMEVEGLVRNGCLAVTLGKRILRMETAAIAASAQVFYELDQE